METRRFGLVRGGSSIGNEDLLGESVLVLETHLFQPTFCLGACMHPNGTCCLVFRGAKATNNVLVSLKAHLCGRLCGLPTQYFEVGAFSNLCSGSFAVFLEAGSLAGDLPAQFICL